MSLTLTTTISKSQLVPSEGPSPCKLNPIVLSFSVHRDLESGVLLLLVQKGKKYSGNFIHIRTGVTSENKLFVIGRPSLITWRNHPTLCRLTPTLALTPPPNQPYLSDSDPHPPTTTLLSHPSSFSGYTQVR